MLIALAFLALAANTPPALPLNKPPTHVNSGSFTPGPRPVLRKVLRPGTPLVEVLPVQLAEPAYYAMPDTAILLEVDAPFPGSLAVAVDQTELQKTESLSEGNRLTAQGLGHFRVLEMTPNGSLFTWKLTITPPPALQAGPGFRINVRSLPPNPTPLDLRRAQPLSIKIGSMLYASVNTTGIKPTDAFCGNIPVNPGATCKPQQQDASDGKVIRRVEVRGWVTSNPRWSDWNNDRDQIQEEREFSILLDWGWTPDPWAVGVRPLNTLQDLDLALTPHNLISFGVDASRRGEGGAAKLDGSGKIWGGPTGLVMHVEVNGWLDHAGGRKDRVPAPDDWRTIPDMRDTKWAFDPVRPPSWPDSRPLQAGDYVRIVGTLWEDHPLPRGDPAKTCWVDGFTKHRGWHEIHPVDYLARIPAPPPHADALESIAICGETSFAREIHLPGPRPGPASKIGYEEVVDGDFTVLRSVGVNSSTGSKSITVLPDGIRVNVTTKGQALSYGAKFKASYRVFWQ